MYSYSDSTNHKNIHVIGLIYPRTVRISALSDYVTEKLVGPLTTDTNCLNFSKNVYSRVLNNSWQQNQLLKKLDFEDFALKYWFVIILITYCGFCYRSYFRYMRRVHNLLPISEECVCVNPTKVVLWSRCGRWDGAEGRLSSWLTLVGMVRAYDCRSDGAVECEEWSGVRQVGSDSRLVWRQRVMTQLSEGYESEAVYW